MRISDWSSDVCSSDLQDRARQRDLWPVESAVEHRAIGLAETAHEPILFLFDLASYEKCHRRGNESEREDQRRGQGEHDRDRHRSEEHTCELQSLMRISYAVFCMKQKSTRKHKTDTHISEHQ